MYPNYNIISLLCQFFFCPIRDIYSELSTWDRVGASTSRFSLIIQFTIDNRSIRGILSFTLRIPPIGHLRDDGRIQQDRFCGAVGIVSLIENEIEITSWTINVIDQEVGRYYIGLRIPLRE